MHISRFSLAPMLALAGLFVLTTSMYAQSAATPADSIIASLQASGLPADNMVVYDATTDPNHLLGRPGQYIAKLSWHDDRAAASDTPESTIEVFATPEALQARFAYVSVIVNSSPLFGQYVFEDDAHLALMRLPFALTPDQAAEYQSWLQAV